MRTRRRTTVPTRLATVSTWQPATQLQRTVTRRRLPFAGNVRDLIRRAAELAAPRRPWRMHLSFFPHRGRRHLFLDCEADAHGVATHVSVALHASDVGLFAYFARHRSLSGVLFVEFPDEDGEDLSVPRVSVAALARMPATIGAA